MTPEQQTILLRAIIDNRGRVEYTHLGSTMEVLMNNGWISLGGKVTQTGYEELRRKLERSRRELMPWGKAEALELLAKHWRP